MIEDYSFEDGFMNDGSVVIFPTDTVFGLACRLYDDEAIDKIHQIKKDDPNHYYAVLCDTVVSVNDLAVIDKRARALMLTFWPGPLTLILNSTLAHKERSGFDKIGVRIPNHEAALDLIKKNGPLITTSLNIDGSSEVLGIDEIKEQFTGVVDYIYEEYNAFYLNITSTTVDLTGSEIKYLRIGSITQEQIEQAIKDES
ncbi:MAG: L-threonylcarbamoyladenylate synthase [Paracholeplasma sp.]|nr:L-threonylcarbamoyladenylate synthase [Paracholeplasma sp.]MDY3195606.1 L-threonylcarbamoyladenylate synthase [Paracholeplasma sp.]